MRNVLAIVALSIGYAMLTWPLVKRLERFVPRGLAIALVDIGIALALAAAARALAPLIYAQAQGLVAALPQAGGPLLKHLDVNLAAYARDGLQAALSLARSFASVVVAVVAIPVLAAYFQLDAPRYERALFVLVPARGHETARRAVEEVSKAVAGFVRGQIAVSSIVAVLVYAVLAVQGIAFAAVIALTTGLFDLVPYLGGVAAFVPSVIFAFAAGGAFKAVVVVLLLGAVFAFEAHVLAPQIIGSRTGLPSSVVVLSLLVGSALFGVLGLYVAVPLAAAGAALLRVVLRGRASSSRLFPPSSVRSTHAHHRR